MLLDTAQTITICAKHQKSIIDEVLTFSKLDSKLIVLAPERVQPLAIVTTVLKMIKPELDYADIHGTVDVQKSYTDLAIKYVLLDPGRLSQILINLMMNAIKFTKASSERHIRIKISAFRTKPTAKDCQVTFIEPREKRPVESTQYLSVNEGGSVNEEIFLFFSVQDTGCGLTEAETKSLFQRFSQASPKTYKQVIARQRSFILTFTDSWVTQYGGSGLGLFISRELVELHGGQVGVHSESEKGSTFAFYIKAASVESPPEATTKVADSPTISSASQVAAHIKPPPEASSISTGVDHPSTTSNARQPTVGDSITLKTEIPDLHVLGEYISSTREPRTSLTSTFSRRGQHNQPKSHGTAATQIGMCQSPRC